MYDFDSHLCRLCAFLDKISMNSIKEIPKQHYHEYINLQICRHGKTVDNNRIHFNL